MDPYEAVEGPERGLDGSPRSWMREAEDPRATFFANVMRSVWARRLAIRCPDCFATNTPKRYSSSMVPPQFTAVVRHPVVQVPGVDGLAFARGGVCYLRREHEELISQLRQFVRRSSRSGWSRYGIRPRGASSATLADGTALLPPQNAEFGGNFDHRFPNRSFPTVLKGVFQTLRQANQSILCGHFGDGRQIRIEASERATLGRKLPPPTPKQFECPAELTGGLWVLRFEARISRHTSDGLRGDQLL